MNRRPLTQQAHAALAAHLQPGDLALDATAGNGHDTLFLARAVHPGGRVFAFDLQTEALQATRSRLADAGLETAVTLYHAGHETLAARLPLETHGRLAAAMFNLGYLPGSDRNILTRPHTTLSALEQCTRLLAPGGLLSVIAYRHHPGGAQEAAAVEAYLAGSGWHLQVTSSPGPVWLLAHRD